MAEAAKVLLVEDTPNLARTYRQYLRNEPYDITCVENGAEALKSVAAAPPDLVLLDLMLPDMHGLDILKKFRGDGIDAEVIVITAHGSVQTAVDAMQAGAGDFLVKPFAADRLRVTIRNALERRQLQSIVETYRETIDRSTFEGFIGSSLSMQATYRIIEAAAPSKATVFITGESGTGKEVCAEAIRALSPRRNKPFIALNCAAIPRELMESEIFGHVKGAFTGALNDRDGAATLADGGTLFLDEVCEMDLDLQAKLLRFLQTETFSKVGGSDVKKVDIRLVCATNKDPLAEVRAERFREDLYYRLHVIPIPLPPLRERDSDVMEIATHFLKVYGEREGKAFSSFAPDVAALFERYRWPGNIRELQNVIQNIVVLNNGSVVDATMLPPQLQPTPLHLSAQPSTVAPATNAGADATISPDMTGNSGTETVEAAISDAMITAPPLKPTRPDDVRPLADIERTAIEDAIAACGGNIRQAASLLGIAPQTIYRKKAVWAEDDGMPEDETA